MASSVRLVGQGHEFTLGCILILILLGSEIGRIILTSTKWYLSMIWAALSSTWASIRGARVFALQSYDEASVPRQLDLHTRRVDGRVVA